MKRIADLRYEHRLSQRDLARAIDVTQASVSQWEANQHSIKGENLLKLSRYFNVSIDDLLGNKLD